ncbi:MULTISPECIES: zinc ribbon domain-containing protein [Actinoalloteichus]|uniref:Zn-ribbon protein n=1 Tax=Actinoalloteichus fjordicus TaxID=1612552 RepID=A0AAC9PUF8_9PSEU|nr:MULTISPECIES: C4-type zinc ribbon domain-containing protein [Actinoalloteichus]APU17062.1 Zn-ribbon protein [Actinoalloteichus fjordicus]APU23143.1 Zn-ribbon protein [Actinoalloteichus sp. GBA129-24]
MKADPATQRRLLDLADVDTELNRVAYSRTNLPEHAEIDESEDTVRTRQDAQVVAETALSDLRRELARQEKEIDQVRARGKRDRELLDAGTVGARQVVDLQHELDTLTRRQGVLEDELLEVMERAEAAETDVRFAEDRLAESREALAVVTRRRDELLADLGTQESRHAERRATLTNGLPADLLALYERIRAQKGNGAALLRARRCGACRLELDRVAVSKLKAADPSEVVRCDECGVILVRTVESGL